MSSRKLIRSTWGVSALTLVSRILGLIRDKFLVVVFGASGVLDAFLFAFTIPNLFRRLFGEGALSAAFIPVFVEFRQERGVDESNRLASEVVSTLILFLSAVVGLGIGVCLLGARFFPDERLMLFLTAMMLPFTMLVCVSALFAAMLQSVRVFALPAAMPVLLNIFMLGSAWMVWRGMPSEVEAQAAYLSGAVSWVAWAVTLAGLAQCVVLLPALFLRKVFVWPRVAWSGEGFHRVLLAMGPTALGLAVFQINVFIDRLIAYALVPGDGALTYLYLGNRLMQLPLALFGISVATTFFPSIVSAMTGKDWKTLLNRMGTAFRFLAFLLLPATFGLIALAQPITRMIFQEPDLSFTHEDVYRTARVLALYAPGLFFIALQQVMTRVFYAEGDYRTPVRVTAAMVGLNVVMNVIFIYMPDLYQRWTWPDADPVRLAEGGLALSTSVAAGISVAVMWIIQKERLIKKCGAELWDQTFGAVRWAVARIALAALAGCGVFAYFVAQSIPTEPELWVRLERGLVSVLFGAIGYGMFCVIFAVPEFDEFVLHKHPEDVSDK